MAKNEKENLQSILIHYSAADFAKYGSECKTTKAFVASIGKRFLDVHPASALAAIEIQGDEITLPSAIALTLVTEGTYSQPESFIAVQQAPAVRIRLKNGDCLLFHLLFNPADQSFAYAESEKDHLVIPKNLVCKSFSNQVHEGMTRAEVQKFFHPDGGICAPFKYERFVASREATGVEPLRLKTNIAFKPAGMTDAVYYLGKWLTPKQSEKDTVTRVSPPYLEPAFND